MSTASATLVNWPTFTVEALWYLWEQSRTKERLQTPEVLHKRVLAGDTFIQQKVEETFLMLLNTDVPVTENLSFTFMLHDVPVALREQLVRHRIGLKVGENFGVDIVPDFPSSTWWSQTMRVMDMGTFHTDEQYRKLPEVYRHLDANGAPAGFVFDQHMHDTETVYNELIQAGVPVEEARMVLPLACSHSISWTLSLAALKHVVGKRACWIAQLGLWEPIIRDMVSELTSKVHPLFAEVAAPPCIERGCYAGCPVAIENERRVTGVDNIPPCSLYMHNEARLFINGLLDNSEFGGEIAWNLINGHVTMMTGNHRDEKIVEFHDMGLAYMNLWHRNPKTGEMLDKRA